MKHWLIGIFLTLLALVFWAAVVIFGTWSGWWRQPLAPPGDTETFVNAAQDLLTAANGGNAVLHLIDRGQIVGTRYVTVDGSTPVDEDSRFQVASLSKWIAAWGILTLVEAGQLDLDTPVSTWLTRWRLPPSEFDLDGVTVRRLLSHTAGLTDGLGYAGFPPGTPVQTLEASLTSAADACCDRDGRVQVGRPPGTGWQYSGGGYTLLQLLVEEVTGETFAGYMERAVLRPLGMHRSTFLLDAEDSDLVTFYDVDGSPAPHFRYTATAAASLYTTAADLSRFLAAHLPGPNGAAPGRGVLQPGTLELMQRPHARLMGVDLWGVGVVLYGRDPSGGPIFGHDGRNAPAINTTARLHAASGDGIVVLATGTHDLASRLGGEWVFWRTGRLDPLMMAAEAPGMLRRIGVGAIAIVLAAVLIGWRRRRRRKV